MDNKKNTILIILTTISIITSQIAILLVVFFVFNNQNSNVFEKNINTIVEVKANTTDIGESFGTGVIIDDKGIVVTNAHVVSYNKLNQQHKFEKIEIRQIKDENYFTCLIIKIDYENDLALLKIIVDNKKFHKIKTSMKKIAFGQEVYSLGNTSNYGIGITKGVISVPKLNIEYDGKKRTVIQVDISIASGNSGGALVNLKGELIGITTFRTKDIKGNINYGFAYAIPISKILDFIEGR